MGNEEQPAKGPRKPEDILVQIEAEAKEAEMKTFKQEAAKITKERDEAARTVRLKNAELQALVQKKKDGLL